jgi:hypothetical protein
MLLTSRLARALLTITAAAPLLCQAESNLQNGAASPLTATAHVDIQITIPKFIFLRVGTGTGTAAGGWGTNGTIDLISWAPSAATVGNGVALAGSGGDLGGGTETAVVVANHGNVTLSSTTLGKLSDGTGDTISYATIKTTASKLTTNQVLPAPGLADGATTTVVIGGMGKAKIVQRDAKWAYTYTNATSPPPGIYGGPNTNNGRVTYTASVP